jgi:hypothetical protein
MSSFDYNAPAELFLSKPTKGSRTKYRRFATAAEAIRYAVEDLRTPKAFGAWLEVGDERFNSSRGDISKGCRVVPADADPRYKRRIPDPSFRLVAQQNHREQENGPVNNAADRFRERRRLQHAAHGGE